MGRILFGDDRSAGSDLAWMWIGDQRWPGWTVDVVTVPESELGPPNLTGSTDLRPWVPDDPRVAPAGAELTAVRHLTAEADPRVVLASAEADLLVVGATGRGLLKRVLHVGSTTEWLLHQPPVPMVVARSGRRVRRVLVGIDGSLASERALEAFVAMPWATDAEVLVLGAYDGWTEPGPAIEQAAKVLEDAGVPHRTEEVRGGATEVLLGAQRREGSQLVVLGARGTSRLHRAIAGSTASALTRASDASVLLAAED